MNLNESEGPHTSTQESAEENERLVQAIAGGDREAERAFVMRYMRPIRAMLLARSRDPELAADLRQDVMIEAIGALRRGQLREPAKLTPFVVAITRNVLNGHYRSASRQPQSVELPEDIPDVSSAFDVAEEQERAKLAEDAISSLELTDKTILQLTLLDGLKPGVIARRLNMNPEVVRQRKTRAIRRVTEFIRRQSQTPVSGDSNVGKIK
jgi:RNA polymerase sigma factor (sigma-70 family)